MGLGQLNFEGKNKVEVAIDRIRQFEPPEGYSLAFSGGKDSVAIYDLAEKSEVKFLPFYNWTGIDPPELYRFVKRNYPAMSIIKPEKSIWRLIQEHHMLPTRIVRYCCEALKEENTPPGWLITGIRWQESPNRRKRRMVETSYIHPLLRFLHPIIDWTDKEVWEYIRGNNIPYCSLYDEGFKRLGCILCPFSRRQQLKMEMERYPQHVKAWRNATNRLYNNGYCHQNFSSGDELFEWWLTREHLPQKNELQCTLFGD